MDIFGRQIPTWPGWETVRLLGRGGYGSVYEIRREVFGSEERAAVKFFCIPPDDHAIAELRDEGYDQAGIRAVLQEQMKRVADEYALMHKLNGCSYVVSSDDLRYTEHADGQGWDVLIKMELLTPLPRYAEQSVGPGLALRLGIDLCHALILCQKHNIIHRDIKPANIFVSDNGDFKLGDFGIAKIMEDSRGGTKIGTFEYMAPEVFHNRPYGHTADIYSLGLVLYWLLNDRRGPFLPAPPAVPSAADRAAAKTRRFQGEELPPPAHGSERFKRVVRKACAFDPQDRYQTAEEFLRDLEHLENAGTPSAVPPRNAEVPYSAAPDSVRPAGEAVASASSGKGKTKLLPILLGAFGVLAAAALIVVLLLKGGEKAPTSAGEQAAVPAAAADSSLPAENYAPGSADTAAPEPTVQPTPEPVPVVTHSPEEYAAKGFTSAGEGLYWKFEGGVLTVAGSGSIRDYQDYSDKTPWEPVQYEVTEIVLEEGIDSVGYRAFSSCVMVERLVFPASLQNIDAYAFSRVSLKEIVTAPESMNYQAVDGVLYSGDMKTLLWYPAQKSSSEFTVPSGVTAIGFRAFQGNVFLRSVQLPEGLTAIGESAFSKCTGLEQIRFPESLLRIEKNAFELCSGLPEIKLPDNLSSIGDMAFYSCSGLSEFVAPRRLQYLGMHCFASCSGLRSADLSSYLSAVKFAAFQDCANLETVVFPEDLTTIDNDAFQGCSSLREADLSDTQLTQIEYEAFAGCSALKTLRLPYTLSAFGDNAFKDCHITDLYYPGTQAEWNAIKGSDAVPFSWSHFTS